jgi:hypothetical protein
MGVAAMWAGWEGAKIGCGGGRAARLQQDPDDDDDVAGDEHGRTVVERAIIMVHFERVHLRTRNLFTVGLVLRE